VQRVEPLRFQRGEIEGKDLQRKANTEQTRKSAIRLLSEESPSKSKRFMLGKAEPD
jgi:hypothetical protein